MKQTKKLMSVLLCMVLLLTLSVNTAAKNEEDNVLSNNAEDVVTKNVVEPRIQNGSIIDNGVYRIKNVNSGKYLNAHYGVDANGTNVYQWTADGSTEQKWRVSYNLATDAYHIYSMCSSGGKKRCLDAADTGGNLTNGANIRLYEPNEPTSQEMMIVSLGNSQYKIVMKQNSNLCLTAYGTSNGTSGGTTSTSAGNVFISTYTGAANQKWNFEYTNSTVVVAPTGWLDSVSATTIRGWAWRSDLPNSPIKVYFNLVNNDTGDEYNFTTNAGTYRSDLQNAGYGNGCHGFNYTIDWRNYLPGNYTVNVFCAAGAAYYLSGSPKTFTVRNMSGAIDVVSSSGISGWAWKPDAPNGAIDVNIQICKTDGTQVAYYSVVANQLRSDLVSAGYGNGYHGFSKTIDWSTLPEERLNVKVYAIDQSGMQTLIYNGYYNNQAIHLIGMIDGEGRDHSAWVTQEVINYAENIGVPRVIKCIGATEENLLNYISNSYFSTVYTHGTQYSLSWSKVTNTGTMDSDVLEWNEMLRLDYDYFSNTNCLLLLACSTASEEDGIGNNIAEAFVNKGVKTVVAFERRISSAFSGTSALTTQGAGFWGKIFVQEIGNGATVDDAKERAFDKLVKNQCEAFNLTEEEYNIKCNDDPEYVDKYIHCGMDSCVVLGEKNQVIRH